MRNLLQTVGKVLDHDVPILILGESGAGKDHLAVAIHACSNRRDGPFVHIDCAAIPAELFESELFGYERGTFTDAQTRKLGRFELAKGGSVYFDNISALPSQLQAKLLRALQEKSFTRLGGHESIPLDARVISSSTGDLDALIARGEFRRDLLYRVNVVTALLPPLRQRPEDIALLIRQFAGRTKKVASGAMSLLKSHRWPGNVRELKNAIERALLVGGTEEITADALRLSASELVHSAARARWTLDQLEETYIREVLKETRSNYSKAATILGINRKTLLEKRKRYGIELSDK
ncbi:MAG: sigma-54-dependent Fis family transcriptional regulator [Thermoanaerobaculia bacterium]|nr:sigma-54-dependent Fis family transcriptional regulator [Thermoanaerobaculia bacterium]